MPGRRLVGAAALAGVCGLAAGCGGASDLDTRGMEPMAYFALFSGDWGFDGEGSDDPQALIDRMETSGRGALLEDADDLPGVGESRTAPGAQALDSAAVRATRHLAVELPPRFQLTVEDSVVVTSWSGVPPVTLRPGGDPVTVSDPDGRLEVEAHWDGPSLVFERTFRRGGTVVDAFAPGDTGRDLIVVRTLSGLPFRGAGEVRLRYVRVGE